MSKFNQNLLNVDLIERKVFQTLTDVVEATFLGVKISSETVLENKTEAPRRNLDEGGEGAFVEGEVDDLRNQTGLE